MPDFKNNLDAAGTGLKHRDAERNGGSKTIAKPDKIFSLPASLDAFKSVKKVRKKDIPVVVDIIIALLLLAVVCGAVFGGYWLFKYFNVNYVSVDLTYVFAVEDFDLPEGYGYSDLKNEYVFFDTDGNTVGFGRIRSAEYNEKSDMLILCVVVNAKYNETEGYSVDSYPIAIGESYSLRTEKMALCGDVVDLYLND